jgi:serine/threonine protein kinase
VRDLNSGTFGFVELAMDKTTGQQVAIKFIERGDKVCMCTQMHTAELGSFRCCRFSVVTH